MELHLLAIAAVTALVGWGSSELGRVHAYAAQALELERALQHNPDNLSASQFEEVSCPLFRQDENTPTGVGAVLGAGGVFATAAVELNTQNKTAYKNRRLSSPVV